MNLESITVKIRAFILDRFPLARKKGIANDSLLLQSGIVDSLGILELVGFMEREFGVRIEDEELLPENFSTIDALAAFLISKMEIEATQQSTGASI